MDARNRLAERPGRSGGEILLDVAGYPRTASGKVQKRLVRQGLGKTLR